MKPSNSRKREKKVKGYAVVARRSQIIKLDLMGILENPYYSIHPQTAKGLKYAQDNCNGNEEVVTCEIVFFPPKQHKCNCSNCDLKVSLPKEKGSK